MTCIGMFMLFFCSSCNNKGVHNFRRYFNLRVVKIEMGKLQLPTQLLQVLCDRKLFFKPFSDLDQDEVAVLISVMLLGMNLNELMAICCRSLI